MKRQHQKYERPRRPFDKQRIEEEDALVEKYGLKNKREIWKAEAAIARIRNQAKKLIVGTDEQKQAFIARLQKKGFKVEKIADVLSLDKEDWLKRRLQTMVHAKGLTTTAKQARQFIVHKHVSVGDRIVNIPSYQVAVDEEPLISLNIVLKQPPVSKDTLQEIKEEMLEEAEVEA
jgi:small subunit ribosomal protein S4